MYVLNVAHVDLMLAHASPRRPEIESAYVDLSAFGIATSTDYDASVFTKVGNVLNFGCMIEVLLGYLG